MNSHGEKPYSVKGVLLRLTSLVVDVLHRLFVAAYLIDVHYNTVSMDQCHIRVCHRTSMDLRCHIHMCHSAKGINVGFSGIFIVTRYKPDH